MRVYPFVIAAIVLAAMLVFANIVMADSATLQWDASDPAPDGYLVFQRTDDGQYDYTAPVVPQGQDTAQIAADLNMVVIENLNVSEAVQPAVPDNIFAQWNKAESLISMSWSQPEAVADAVTYYWVVRAFIADEQSPDSNEASHTFTAPSYVDHWKVYYGASDQGPWTELATMDSNGQMDQSISTPITSVPEGQRQTIYFTVVAFNADGGYSPNSTAVEVDVDRRELIAPTGLRVTINIPVE